MQLQAPPIPQTELLAAQSSHDAKANPIVRKGTESHHTSTGGEAADTTLDSIDSHGMPQPPLIGKELFGGASTRGRDEPLQVTLMNSSTTHESSLFSSVLSPPHTSQSSSNNSRSNLH